MSDLASRLLAVAARQVHERGASAVTVRSVAAEAEVSGTALYLHYRSRGHLIDLASAYAFRDMASRLAGGSPTPTVGAVVDAYLREASGNPVAYRHLTQGPGSAALAWTTLLAPLHRALVQALHDGRACPGCPAALTVVAATHGAISLHLAGSLPPTGATLPSLLTPTLARLTATHPQEHSCTA